VSRGAQRKLDWLVLFVVAIALVLYWHEVNIKESSMLLIGYSSLNGPLMLKKDVLNYRINSRVLVNKK